MQSTNKHYIMLLTIHYSLFSHPFITKNALSKIE